MVHAVAAQSTRGSAHGDLRSGLHAFDFWADDAEHYCRLSRSEPPAEAGEPSTSEQAAPFVLPTPMLEPHAACLYAFRPVCYLCRFTQRAVAFVAPRLYCKVNSHPSHTWVDVMRPHRGAWRRPRTWDQIFTSLAATRWCDGMSARPAGCVCSWTLVAAPPQVRRICVAPTLFTVIAKNRL